jgi:DNA-binding NarL/FixJ family response regulator
VSRVLLGNLEPMVRLGMTTILGEGGIEIVGSEERPAALLLMAGRLRPDAVVLDAASRDLGERVRAASPETTVVFWMRDEEVMEVVTPSGTRRVADPQPAELCGELARSQVNRVEG